MLWSISERLKDTDTPAQKERDREEILGGQRRERERWERDKGEKRKCRGDGRAHKSEEKLNRKIPLGFDRVMAKADTVLLKL